MGCGELDTTQSLTGAAKNAPAKHDFKRPRNTNDTLNNKVNIKHSAASIASAEFGVTTNGKASQGGAQEDVQALWGAGGEGGGLQEQLELRCATRGGGGRKRWDRGSETHRI